MEGKRTLEYIRSRSSEDLTEGTDLARSSRQMHVINAFIDRLTQRSFIFDPVKTGSAYAFWSQYIETNMTDSDAVALLLSLDLNNLSIISRSIPTSYDTLDNALLINPPLSKHGLWVWEPRDNSWKQLQDYIRENPL